jgi:nitrite reductase (NADH) large subunit
VNLQTSIMAPRHADAKERLVVIGNGMAGCRAVEEILALEPDRCPRAF